MALAAASARAPEVTDAEEVAERARVAEETAARSLEAAGGAASSASSRPPLRGEEGSDSDSGEERVTNPGVVRTLSHHVEAAVSFTLSLARNFSQEEVTQHGQSTASSKLQLDLTNEAAYAQGLKGSGDNVVKVDSNHTAPPLQSDSDEDSENDSAELSATQHFLSLAGFVAPAQSVQPTKSAASTENASASSTLKALHAAATKLEAECQKYPKSGKAFFSSPQDRFIAAVPRACKKSGAEAELESWQHGWLAYWATRADFNKKKEPKGYIELTSISKVTWERGSPKDVGVKYKEDGETFQLILVFRHPSIAQAWSDSLYHFRQLLECCKGP